jgi:head-tail adaptor
VSLQDYYTESAYYKSHVQFSTSVLAWAEPGFSAGTTFSAAINPVSGSVRLSAGKDTLFADYKLLCSDTVAISVHDRVVYSGSSMDVVFVKYTLNKGHHKLVYLKDRSD